MPRPKKTQLIQPLSKRVWDYYTAPKNDNLKDNSLLNADKVKCILCPSLLASQSVSSLIEHLKCNHQNETQQLWSNKSQVDADVGDVLSASTSCQLESIALPTLQSVSDSIAAISRQGNAAVVNRQSKQPSLVWRYFEKKTPDTAACNTCHKVFKSPSGSTTNLFSHLLHRHAKETTYLFSDNEVSTDIPDSSSISFPIDATSSSSEIVAPHGESPSPPDDSVTTVVAKRRKHPSVVWKYFSKAAKNGAKCNFCRRLCKTRGFCTTNLFAHLRHKHRKETQDLEDWHSKFEPKERFTSAILASSRTSQSFVWEFFSSSDNGKVICSLCLRSFIESPLGKTKNLIRHLCLRHSDVMISRFETNNPNIVATYSVGDMDPDSTSVRLKGASSHIRTDDERSKLIVEKYFSSVHSGGAATLSCCLCGELTSVPVPHLRLKHAAVFTAAIKNIKQEPHESPVDEECMDDNDLQDSPDTGTVLMEAGNCTTEATDEQMSLMGRAWDRHCAEREAEYKKELALLNQERQELKKRLDDVLEKQRQCEKRRQAELTRQREMNILLQPYRQ